MANGADGFTNGGTNGVGGAPVLSRCGIDDAMTNLGKFATARVDTAEVHRRRASLGIGAPKPVEVQNMLVLNDEERQLMEKWHLMEKISEGNPGVRQQVGMAEQGRVQWSQAQPNPVYRPPGSRPPPLVVTRQLSPGQRSPMRSPSSRPVPESLVYL